MTTSRALVSRNKREGGYLGRYRSVWDDGVDRPRRRHHRKGGSMWRTLRVRSLFAPPVDEQGYPI